MSVQVIVLNGGSSSGTTSVARALQDLLPEPHLLLGVDTLIEAMPSHPSRHDPAITVDSDGTVRPGPAFRALEQAWYQGVASMARCGAPVIVDEVFLGGGHAQARLRDTLSGLSVLWVAVHCDPAVAAAREASRADRDAGMAAAQAESVHRGVDYDLHVDTTHTSPEQCARTIADRLAADQ